MAEYTAAIDAHISATLRQRGYVDGESIPGLMPDEGAACLTAWYERHGSDGRFTFDGRRLSSVVEAVPETSPSTEEPPSPVDQVIGYSDRDSLLYAKPSGGTYPGWAWLLPLSLGIIGGIGGWLIVREHNARAARGMMIAGVVVQVMSIAFGLFAMGSLGSMVGSATSVAWTPSSTGRPALYYFGTST